MKAWIEKWRVALIAGLVLGLVFGLIDGFSIFMTPLVTELEIHRSQASIMYACYLIAGTLCAPLVGSLVDRFGARKVIFFTLPLFSLGLLCNSLASSLWHFYLIYIGLLSASFTVLVIAAQYMVNSAYPSSMRGRALGIAYAGLGLGNLLFFSVLAGIVKTAGWRIAYVATGIIGIIGWLIFFFVSRHLPQTSSTLDETRCSLSQKSEQKKPMLLRQITFWYLSAAAFSASTMDFFVFQQLVPFWVTKGLSTHHAGLLLGMASIGYSLGHITAGHLSDKIGREATACLSAVIFSLGLLIIWVVPPWLVTTLGTLLLGSSVGGIIGCRAATVGDIYAGAALGRVTGLIQVFSAAGAALGTWSGSHFYDTNGSYASAFVLVGLLSVIWIVMIWMAAPRRHRSGDRQ